MEEKNVKMVKHMVQLLFYIQKNLYKTIHLYFYKDKQNK